MCGYLVEREKTMSIIKDTFFGGAEKDAAKQQMRAFEQSQDFVREGVAQGREDINRLFPQAQDMTMQGFQGAMDVFNQAVPQQMQAFQQGNMGAQNALLAGAPQFQNAILGGPVDYSQMQAQQLNMPEINYQMPDFMASQQPNVQELTANQPVQYPQGLADMLANYSGNGTFGNMITGLAGRAAQQVGNQSAGPRSMNGNGGFLDLNGGVLDFSQRSNLR